VGHNAKEARQPQVGRDDHHSEEEHQGVGVHRGHRLVPGQHTGHYEDRRPDDGHARAVHAEEREPAEGQAEIGTGERHQRDQPFDAQLVHGLLTMTPSPLWREYEVLVFARLHAR